MKLLVVLSVLLGTSNVFALGDCFLEGKAIFAGSQVSVSAESLKGCPMSFAREVAVQRIRKYFVAHLQQIQVTRDGMVCVYTHAGSNAPYVCRR